MAYAPSKPPQVSTSDGQALANYLNDELQILASALRNFDSVTFAILHVPPPRPRTGMVVYADGTQWNPGSGKGLYGYGADGLWHFLG